LQIARFYLHLVELKPGLSMSIVFPSMSVLSPLSGIETRYFVQDGVTIFLVLSPLSGIETGYKKFYFRWIPKFYLHLVELKLQ